MPLAVVMRGVVWFGVRFAVYPAFAICGFGSGLANGIHYIDVVEQCTVPASGERVRTSSLLEHRIYHHLK